MKPSLTKAQERNGKHFITKIKMLSTKSNQQTNKIPTKIKNNLYKKIRKTFAQICHYILKFVIDHFYNGGPEANKGSLFQLAMLCVSVKSPRLSPRPLTICIRVYKFFIKLYILAFTLDTLDMQVKQLVQCPIVYISCMLCANRQN